MPHHRTDGTGALVTHARRYELGTSIALLGLRGRLFGRLAAHAGVGPGDRVLDVGCGTGALTHAVAEAVSPGGLALGIDPSPPMVAYARRLAARRGDGSVFALGAAQGLAAQDGSFDAVVSSFAVHHMPPELRGRAFAEMFRVLRPGGRLLIADFRRVLEGHRGLVEEAGFTGLTRGRVRPAAHWIRAVRP